MVVWCELEAFQVWHVIPDDTAVHSASLPSCKLISSTLSVTMPYVYIERGKNCHVCTVTELRHAIEKGLLLPQGLDPSTLSGHPRVFWGCVPLHRLRRGLDLLLH